MIPPSGRCMAAERGWGMQIKQSKVTLVDLIVFNNHRLILFLLFNLVMLWLCLCWPLQVWECRGGSELWDDAEGVSAPRAPGPDGALLRGLLLLLPLRGALHFWHRLGCFRLLQGWPPHHSLLFPAVYNPTWCLISRPLVFHLRISSPDTRSCAQTSWRTTMTGWAVRSYSTVLISDWKIASNTPDQMSSRCSRNMRSFCIRRTTSPNDSLWRWKLHCSFLFLWMLFLFKRSHFPFSTTCINYNLCHSRT